MPLTNHWNQFIYRLWAPFYDRAFTRPFGRSGGYAARGGFGWRRVGRARAAAPGAPDPLDNALRYTPFGGSIQLGALTQARTMTIHISDTGSGIALEHLPRLLDRFYRGVPARTSASGGTGLGLAIAKGLVEAQGGQIAIESLLGHGTHVTLTLPTAPLAQVAAS